MTARRASGAGTPVIGVTMDTNWREKDGKSVPISPGHTTPVFLLNKSYADAVAVAGGLPVLIPAMDSPSAAVKYLAMLDGLLLSGGDFDIDPAIYGEKPVPRLGALKPVRTAMEMKLLKGALRLKMPVLGICGGHQLINVAFGGTLWQDIPSQTPSSIKHSQNPIPSTKPSHEISVAPGSALAEAVDGAPALRVNSTHHQCVKKLGRGLCASSTAPDGLVESLERKKPGGGFLLGVQWHPERLVGSDQTSRLLFRKFVAEASRFRATRQFGPFSRS